jgi:hypothetical protein
MNSKNNNTALIVIAVIAAFGLVMATAAVLAIVPQAHALGRPACSTTKTNQCGLEAQGQFGSHPPP